MRLPTFLRRLFGIGGRRIEFEAGGRRASPMEARYHAAGNDPEMASLWAYADALSADAANSLHVRKRLRERSRLEQSNGGYAIGMVRTNANYVIGRGPTLKMETRSAAFNSMVEARWQSWCKAVGFARKLRVACKAKTGDGEGFLEIVTNPGVRHDVKLDLAEFECDQISSPYVPQEAGRIDGVRFDQWGNPEAYEVLDAHPGGLQPQAAARSRWVPARFMCHWFLQDRPRQHRGTPEATATVSLFGEGRRYRKAVIAAAETAADFAAMLEMEAGNEGPDEVKPFSSLPIEKRMLIATPAGGKVSQMRAEQPPTTYEMFNRSIVSEEARPLSMSYSIAACDSSGNSFSGTQNDHLTFYQSADTDRADCEEVVCDKVFRAWFEEAVLVYGWAVPASPEPRHGWGWPPMPQVDAQKAASADKGELEIGVPPSVVAARRGADFADWVNIAAADYGITPEEYRQRLFAQNMTKAGAPAGGGGDGSAGGEEGSPGAGGNGAPQGNGAARGNGRLPAGAR